MGSGSKFRINWLPGGNFGLGVHFGVRMEHEVSIDIVLFKLNIYIGFGKGYEEFR